jgi:hypothetical protein
MRMCFKSKKIMKLDHKIKDTKIVFLSCKLWSLMEHGLLWVFFLMFGHAHLFLFFIMVALT